jgi:hypothetical protein
MVLRSVAACAAGAILATGCGGGNVAGTEGADRVPASADLFIAVNTDFEGDQWKAAGALVDKFPGGAEGVRQLLGSLEEEDVDFERDVKPAVGPEVDVVILDFKTGEEPEVVALTQPRDRGKFEALMKKGNDPTAVEFADEWAIVAESQDVIDRFQQAADEGDPLAESDPFKDAMDGLPDDALARVYVNARALGDVASAGAQLQTEQLEQCAPGGRAKAYAAAIQAEQEGVRFEAVAPTDGGDEPESYDAKLPEELPAGALAYVSFNNLADPIRAFIRCAGEQNENVDRTLAQAELALGLSLEDDVLPLLENEGAITVYRAPEGQQIPVVSLVLGIGDEDEARATLDRIAERASGFVDGVQVSETEIGGVAAKQVTFPDGDFPLLYAVFDGKIVVTTAEAGITGLRGDGEKLENDEIYEQALDSADVPDETTGFFYANLEAGIDYVFGLATASGDEAPPPQVRDNLEPLQSLLLYGSFADDEAKAAGLLRVE